MQTQQATWADVCRAEVPGEYGQVVRFQLGDSFGDIQVLDITLIQNAAGTCESFLDLRLGATRSLFGSEIPGTAEVQEWVLRRLPGSTSK